MPITLPLLVSLKDRVAKNLNDQTVSDAFRQIEIWSKTVNLPTLNGLPPPTTSSSTVSYTDPTGQVWVANANVSGGQYRPARDVLHGRIFRNAAWTTSTTLVQFSYDTVYRDLYGMFSAGGWVIPVTGRYLWTATLSAAVASGGFLQADCQDTTTSTDLSSTVAAGASSGPAGNTATAVVSFTTYVAAGDLLKVFQRASTAVAGGVGYTWASSSLSYIGSS